MIRCFGVTPYWGDGEDRDCVIHAASNVMFLRLGQCSAAYEVSRLNVSITLASAHCRPHTKRHPEVSDLFKLGHLGLILQNAGDILISEKWLILVKDICSRRLVASIGYSKRNTMIAYSSLAYSKPIPWIMWLWLWLTQNDGRVLYTPLLIYILSCYRGQLFLIAPVLEQTKSKPLICMKCLETNGNTRLAMKSNGNFSPYRENWRPRLNLHVIISLLIAWWY